MRSSPRLVPVAALAVSLAACGDAAPAPTPSAAPGAPSMATAPRPAPAPTVSPAPPPLPDLAPEARRAWDAHCAACHGPDGGGDGPAAALLDPRPWRFEGGLFKLGASSTAAASDADLRAVIRRGVPGTSMPGLESATDADVDALVAAVRHFSLRNTAVAVRGADPSMSPDEVVAFARTQTQPGPDIVLPPRPAEPVSDAVPAAWERKCAECHGADGTARGATETGLRDTFGFDAPARDLTRAPLKGGDAAEDLARRVVRGMPGTAMPQADLAPADVWAVVAHVQRLRANVVAAAEGRRAIGATATRIALRPLRDPSRTPLAATVRATRDAAGVTLHVEWTAAGDGPFGAAVRVVSVAGATSFAEDAGRAVRWHSSPDVPTGASAPPAWVPLSEAPADAAPADAGTTRDGVRAVALSLAGLDPGTAVVVSVWDGRDAAGRALEAFSAPLAIE